MKKEIHGTGMKKDVVPIHALNKINLQETAYDWFPANSP